MKQHRVCVIRRGRYPTDPRLHRHVRALVEAGHEVDVLCKYEPGRALRERRGALSIRRVWAPSDEGSIARLALHYAAFFAGAVAIVTARHLRRRYDLVLVRSLPDALVFAAAVPRRLGARVVLDLAEPAPEYFASRFGTSSRHPGVRLCALAERMSVRFADRVMTCTEHLRETFVSRGADAAKIGVVLDSADEAVFDVQRHPHRGSDDGGFLLVCHGTVEARYGIDTIIRAIGALRHEIPGLRLEVYGTGSSLPDLERLTRDLGLEERVWFSRGFVPIGELLDALARADAGVVAMRRDAYRDVTHTNKMFDFIAMRVPVLMSRTSSVEAYFGESCFEYFESGDPRDLAAAIRRLHADPARRERLVRRASEVVEPYRWERQREVFLEQVGLGPPAEVTGSARSRESVAYSASGA